MTRIEAFQQEEDANLSCAAFANAVPARWPRSADPIQGPHRVLTSQAVEPFTVNHGPPFPYGLYRTGVDVT